eukprot:75291-Pyramimonas_sp.AAC.3
MVLSHLQQGDKSEKSALEKVRCLQIAVVVHVQVYQHLAFRAHLPTDARSPTSSVKNEEASCNNSHTTSSI